MEQQGEIILYQPNETVKLEVRLENETVWLTQAQMAELFQTTPQNITIHIRSLYKEEELDITATCKEHLQVRQEGHRTVTRKQKFYNLDVIISVGYRVKSKYGTKFRQWATKVLKEYLLKGYAINQRMERLEERVAKTEEKIDFFVRTSLPPVEGIFFEGQIFDAYVFAANLIKSAKETIILIDNYIDESTLMMLSKRNEGVKATIYTAKLHKQLQLDLQRHNAEYPPVTIRTYKQSHDRFLIIDSEVFHLGASLKDLGKKWFAFSRLHFPPQELIKRILIETTKSYYP